MTWAHYTSRTAFPVLLLGLELLLVTAASVPSHAEPVEKSTHCNMESIQASFTAALSSYHVEANCTTTSTTTSGVGTTTNITIPWRWSSQGFYDFHGRMAREDVRVWYDNASSAAATTTLSCPTDPWLGPSLGGGKAVCTNAQFNAGGDVMDHYDFLIYLRGGFRESQLPNSTGFQYTRAALIAQRDADLKAEADAARAAQEQAARRLHKKAQPAPTFLENLAPFVLFPAPGSIYLSQTAVPIKVAPPPRRMTITGYTVRIERKDSGGAWVFVTNLPMSPAVASSPSGYLEWGAPGNGRGAAMIAGPGTYRISAQVSAPRPTGWSVPNEFVVMSPNKAVQKSPKGFGP